MAETSRATSLAQKTAVWVLLVLPLVVAPLAGLVTPYFIGLTAIVVGVVYLFTGRILRAYDDFAARALLLLFTIILVLFIISAKRPGDVLFALNFSILVFFGPMRLTLERSAKVGNDLIVARLAMLGLALALAMTFYQSAMGEDRAHGFNLGPIVLSNGALALAAMAMLPLARGTRKRDLLWLLAPVMAVVIVLLTRSRGPLLALPPLFLVTAVMLWRTRFKEFKWFPWLVGAFVIIVVVGALLLPHKKSTNLLGIITEFFQGAPVKDETTRIRLALYAGAWQAFFASPWIGHGWANLMTSVAPYVGRENLQYAQRLPQLHDDFLDFAVAGGVVGIGAYFGMLTAPLIAALRSVRDALYATRVYGTAALLVIYAFAGLTDLMFGHEFHTALFVVLNAILLGYCREAVAGKR